VPSGHGALRGRQGKLASAGAKVWRGWFVKSCVPPRELQACWLLGTIPDTPDEKKPAIAGFRGEQKLFMKLLVLVRLACLAFAQASESSD
jgi:hypothetical protein